MMKSADKIYDMILLDDDLGATNGDAAPLRGMMSSDSTNCGWRMRFWKCC